MTVVALATVAFVLIVNLLVLTLGILVARRAGD